MSLSVPLPPCTKTTQKPDSSYLRFMPMVRKWLRKVSTNFFPLFLGTSSHSTSSRKTTPQKQAVQNSRNTITTKIKQSASMSLNPWSKMTIIYDSGWRRLASQRKCLNNEKKKLKTIKSKMTISLLWKKEKETNSRQPMLGLKSANKCAQFPKANGPKTKLQTSTLTSTMSTDIAVMTLAIICATILKEKQYIILLAVASFSINRKTPCAFTLPTMMTSPASTSIPLKELQPLDRWADGPLWSFGTLILLKSRLSSPKNLKETSATSASPNPASMSLPAAWTTNTKSQSMTYKKILLLPLDKDPNLSFLPLNFYPTNRR